MNASSASVVARDNLKELDTGGPFDSVSVLSVCAKT